MSKAKSLPAGAEEHAVKILDRVWTLSRKRTAAKSKRENLFTERDSIDMQIDQLSDAHSHEGQELSAKWRDVVKQLERLKIDIDFYGDEIDRAISEGEQGKFDFVEDPIKPPPTLYDRLKPRKREEPAAADDRPVGTPNGKTPVGTPAPAPPEGVDQHLAAAVSELDIPDRLARVLHQAEISTIGDLVRLADGPQPLAAALQPLGIGVDNCKLLEKALNMYRKKHRKAMAAAEREEAGE